MSLSPRRIAKVLDSDSAERESLRQGSRIVVAALLAILLGSLVTAALTGFLDGAGVPISVVGSLGALAWFLACTYALVRVVDRVLERKLEQAWMVTVPSLALAVAVAGISNRLGAAPLASVMLGELSLAAGLSFMLKESLARQKVRGR